MARGHTAEEEGEIIRKHNCHGLPQWSKVEINVSFLRQTYEMSLQPHSASCYKYLCALKDRTEFLFSFIEEHLCMSVVISAARKMLALRKSESPA